ncbi:NAD(P)-binding protein [Melanomma pulvis-pyrius CBS 109.77]|uniref:Short-chain dehydrogenase/reductase 3 n=1 Tax=Melanomma pulvis-pyrius CBS 109.77 TaxID=1314802 RepID=A0A6A6X521_9PLEO|nr:NAD(P)-binding protein [Melanomma pulvis-pyrius CBS 109.77]
MIRAFVFATAFLVLQAFLPLRLPSLPFSEEQHVRVFTILKWLLAACFLREANAILSRWAENRWLWKDDKSAWQWTNELAVVTGGSKGIGASVVERLVSYGIKVAVLDLEPLSEELQTDEENLITFYQCDITSREEVHKAAEAIRSDHGPPSILINNAGIGNANTILEMTPRRLRAIFDVNLLSHWNTVQEFLPDMIAKKKGHIMSTASLAAFLGLAGMVDYSCTKAGLIAFHEGLTQELKHRYHAPQIKTSIVYPNWTRTRLIEGLTEGIQRSRAPIVEPKDVAEAMVRQIIAARSGQVVLGPSGVASIRALPMWLQEFIRDRMAQVVTINSTTAVA